MLLSCVPAQHSGSDVLLQPFFSLVYPAHSTSTMNPPFCTVLCCFVDPNRDLLRMDGSDLLRLSLNQTTTWEMGWPVFGFGKRLSMDCSY